MNARDKKSAAGAARHDGGSEPTRHRSGARIRPAMTLPFRSRFRLFGRRAFLLAALALVCLAAYSPILKNGFVNYDDDRTLLWNKHVSSGVSLDGLRWAFVNVDFPNWHPLTWISHMLDFELFGTHAAGHHAVSVLIHAANAVLLARLLGGLTGTVLRSMMVAALFALHPLRVESVAWASERKDVLSLLFGLLALAAWLRYVRRRSAGAYAGALVLFACSLMSKQLLVTLPGIMLLLDYWPLGRSRCHGAYPSVFPDRRILVETAPFLALAAVASVVTFIVQRAGGAVATTIAFPVIVRVANGIRSYGAYLVDTIWPAKLAVFYPFFWADVPWWEPALGAFVIVLASAVVLILIRRRPELFVGWSWYLVTLVPMIGFVQVGSQARADRYTYLPHIGLFLALVWTVATVAKRRPEIRSVTAVTAILSLTVLSLLTTIQVTRWRDSVSLFGHAMAVTDNNYVAYSNLGSALAKLGRTTEGNKLIALSYKTNPYSRAQLLSRAGDHLVERGRMSEAAENYRQSLAIIPYDRVVRKKLEALEDALGGRAGEPPAPGRATR